MVDYESVLQSVYEAILGSGDVAVDVGAHVGRHTIPIARRVLPDGRVLAFEPLPMCRDELVRTLLSSLGDGAKSVAVFPYALGESDGAGQFVVARDALAYSGLRERTYDIPTGLERIDVVIRKLDTVLADLPSLRYIKVDAEGGDFHILRGAKACLEKHRPVVSFEFGLNSAEGYDITPGDMADMLGGLAYRILDINGIDVSDPVSLTRSATRQAVWDYIGIPSEDDDAHARIVAAIQRHHHGCPTTPKAEALCSELRISRPVSREPGGSAHFLLRARNCGTSTWPRWTVADEKGSIRIGILWFAIGRPEHRLVEQRAELPLPLSPGEHADVDIPLVPIGNDQQPLPPGSYEVWVALVQEHVAWFYEWGGDVLKLRVTVDR
jgi:FkbM family methyltransferase